MNEGWKCPVCGRGVAPSVKDCSHGGTEVSPFYPALPLTPLQPLYDTNNRPYWWDTTWAGH
jgi:hypothetical protein